IKENGTAIVYDQSDEAKDVIKDICKEKNAKYIEVKFDDINIKQSDIYSQVYDCSIMGKKYEDLEIKLIGDHQVNNSILALSAIDFLKETKGLNITEEDIRKGLINTKWPGRIEKIMEKPIFIIDGAHNEDG
ncbi:bifunctional folylpolyglutamate synthase/dihydrofolate synthase, partial [Clostridium tertium]